MLGSLNPATTLITPRGWQRRYHDERDGVHTRPIAGEQDDRDEQQPQDDEKIRVRARNTKSSIIPLSARTSGARPSVITRG